MKRIYILIFVIAALNVACTKDGVTYTESNEIGFNPVPENITKGAIVPAEGNDEALLPNTHQLGIFAYRKSDEEPTTAPDYDNRELYLNNAIFEKKQILVQGKQIEGWGGADNKSYPWPLNGSLVFAGYNKPEDAVINASFDLASNIMTFTDYVQSNDKDNTFDLCWFGRTASSYNNRVSGESIYISMEHALSWITVRVQGNDDIVTQWTITDMYFDNLGVKSSGSCYGLSRRYPNGYPTTWGELKQYDDMKLIDESFQILNSTVICGGVNADDDPGIVVIPQQPVNLVVKYKRSGSAPVETKEVSLKLNEENNLYWAAGKHYVYTLKFKANEILVAPSFGEWGNGTDQTIVVE